MEKNKINSSSSYPEQNPGINWHNTSCLVNRLVTKWVYSAKIATWLSQRDDIVADIVQDAMVRSLWRIQRGMTGELPPVRSVQSLCIRIAHNCFIDKIRSDRRLLPILANEPEQGQNRAVEEENLSEVAAENVFTASLFEVIVAEVINFPRKLRTALFIDLASRMSFKGEPTALQLAFIQAGVALHEYRRQVPSDPVARSRHAALVSLAYKRIRELESVRAYIASQ